jgi:polysaccharide pyruvyl transferase WcaK-like protein
MRISIITILDNQNIGTYLQAYSLACVLKENGADVEYVDYRRKSESLLSSSLDIFRKKNNNFIRSLVSVVYRVISVGIGRYKLRSFLRNKANYTNQVYHNIVDLKSNIPVADIYMTGSDQVWNSNYNNGVDASFYLSYAPANKKKVAYAASIGMEDYPESEKQEVKNLLSKYDGISVREQKAKDIISNIGINDVEVVLDPTLLLDRYKWSLLADEASFEKKEPYVLVYSVEDTKKGIVEKCARTIAGSIKGKVYQVSSGWFRDKIDCDKFFPFSTPQLFVKLFREADYVVVSSFHGTAFSVNMNKQFVSVAPNQYSSRMRSFLEMLKLEDRIVVDDAQKLLSLTPIDYNVVNKKMDEKRFHSCSFINKYIC